MIVGGATAASRPARWSRRARSAAGTPRARAGAGRRGVPVGQRVRAPPCRPDCPCRLHLYRESPHLLVTGARSWCLQDSLEFVRARSAASACFVRDRCWVHLYVWPSPTAGTSSPRPDRGRSTTHWSGGPLAHCTISIGVGAGSTVRRRFATSCCLPHSTLTLVHPIGQCSSVGKRHHCLNTDAMDASTV